MGDSSKKDLTNGNRIRKSRNELIRESLGQYLKHRNFVPVEKYRKSDFILSQTKKQFMFNKMIDKDLSKVNSFLYSNVLCLTNNHATVDQQFTKFVKFVEIQSEPIKSELSNIFGPLICHLYIELLKGREWKPAMEFLRKNCHLVGPVENYNAPLPNKINGCSIAMKPNHNDEPILPATTTQILFTSDSTGNLIRDHFKDLIQTLSQCLRFENFETIESIILFRSSKYDIELSFQSLNAIEKYLKSQGHLIILNIFHIWINFEITDLKDIENQETNGATTSSNSGSGLLSILDDDFDRIDETTNTPNIIENGNDLRLKYLQNSIFNNILDKKSQILITPEKTFSPSSSCSGSNKKASNTYLRRLKHSAMKLQKIEQPARNFLIANQELTSAGIDNNECHIVGGFENSLVKLWQLNQNTCPGKNLYKKQMYRHCEWDSNNNFEETEDDEEESEEFKNNSRLGNYLVEQKKLKSEDEFNYFDDSGGICLRGHSRGVTDLMFSKKHPILLTVSKDNTMRLWKSINYKCSAIYRGHNYPIWCIDESPLGMYVSTGSKDLTARLWTLDREFPLITYVGHTQDVDCIAFHPNGNYLATGSCDLSVRLWSVTTGRLFRVFTDCKYPITRISFSPDGKYLAAAGDENKVRIFDLAAGSQIIELKDHSAPITDIVWNKNGRLFASSCSDGTVRLWDVAKLGSTDPKSANNKIYSCLNYPNRPVKIIFNSSDMLTCISTQ